MAKKNSQENPFDEQSQSNRKGHNKEQKLKFSLSSFKALPIEEQIKVAKEQANSENGFAHPYILDIYNKYVSGNTDSTGKSSSYKKPPRPTQTNKTENPQNTKNQNEFNDLSQLGEVKNNFPEKVTKKGQMEGQRNKNKEARTTAINKAKNLDPDNGETVMKGALAEVVEEEKSVIATTEEQVDLAVANDETATTEGATSQPKETQPTKAEMLAQLQEKQAARNEKAKAKATLEEEKATLKEENLRLAEENTISSPEPKKEGDIPVPPQPKDPSSEKPDNNTGPKLISLDDQKIKLVQEINSLLDEENKTKEEYFTLQEKIELHENKLKEINELNKKIEEISEKKDLIEININQIISKNSNYENDKEYKKLKDEFTKLDQENQNLNNDLNEIKQNINIAEADKEKFIYLANKRQEISDKLKEKTDELEKFKITKIQTKNDKVLEELENTTYLNIDDSPTESNIKGISNLQKEFFKNASEKVKNAFNKSLEWMGKFDESKAGKVKKAIVSGAMIGTALYFTGDAMKVLPQNANFYTKISSRVFGGAITTAIMNSRLSQDFKNLSTGKKALIGGSIVILGAGGFAMYAGSAALLAVGAKAGLSMATGLTARFASNKFFKLNEKIKIAEENTKPKIDELNKKIEELGKQKETLGENFFTELAKLEQDKNTINKELRKLRGYKTIENGIISFASGLTYMGAEKLIKDESIQNIFKLKNITKSAEEKSWWSKLFAKKEISNRSIVENKYGNPEDLKEPLKLKPENNLPKFIKSSENNSEISQETTKVDRTLLDNQKPILEDTRAEEDKIDLKKINEKIINTNQTDNSIQEPVQEEKELETEHSQKPETNTENTTTEETTVEKSNVTEEETKVNNPPEAQDSSKLNKVRIDENKKPIVSEELNNETEETNTTEQDKASEVKPIENTEKVTGDKVDIKTIKPESIIDSQKNVGETYVYRNLIRSDSELAEKLAKYQGLDLDKVNDNSYMANYLKKLAIKLGRMDNEGHEIRYNEKAINDISLKLDVDKDGKLISYEIDKEGVIKDVHHEGEGFEKDLEEYEETKLQKTYSKIEEAYDKNGGLVKPEKVVSTLDDPFSNSYLNGDDSQEYLEAQYGNNQIVKPDQIADDNIIAPEKVAQVYRFENIQNSPDWANLKENNLKDFFATGKINMSEEEVRVAESLRAFYKAALESSNNDEDFKDFIRNNPKLTIGESTNLYNDVIKEEGFTENLKEKYHFYDWKDSLSRVEVKSATMQEMEKIAKDNFKGKFTQSELKSVNRFYEKNLNLIIKEDRDTWYEYKDQGAKDYLKTYKDDYGDFTNFLRNLKRVTGLEPKSPWLGHKEQLDEYIMRATMKAKLDGRLDEINLLKKTTIIEANQTDTENYEDYKPSQKEKYDDKPYNKNTTKNIPSKENDLKDYKPSKKTSDDLYREN